MDANTSHASQFVIGRFGDGTNHPAKQIVGKHFVATAETHTQTTPCIVVTEDYGQRISQWRGGTARGNYRDAILSPVVRDCVIEGASEDSSLTAYYQRMADQPDRYHGLLMAGSGMRCEGTRIHGIPGTAARFVRPVNPRRGPRRVHDRTRARVVDLSVSNSFRGIDNKAPDSTVMGCEAADCRDYGIHYGVICHAIDNHVWGCQVGHWFTNTGASGGEIYGDNCGTGLLIDGWRTRIHGYSSVGCWHSAATINGTRNSLIGFMVRDAPVSIHGQRNNLSHGTIETWGKTDCVVLGNGTYQVIDHVQLNPGKGRWGITAKHKLNYCEIAVHVYGGAGGINLVSEDGASLLGRANTIRITTSGNTEQPVHLPAKWNDDVNYISVNGKQLRA